MNTERHTQNRIIALFREELGYRFLGDWSDRDHNSNVEERQLSDNLLKRGYSETEISAALRILLPEADNQNRGLYANNKRVYELLRYGISVRTPNSSFSKSVQLIDWDDVEANDFAIAEEVTLKGERVRRPDLVLYVNGIAIGVIELKSGRVSVAEGIRQCLSNQQKAFHEGFFSTVQFVFAGNDTEGLRYGTILTPEKYFLQWKEDEADNSEFKLDKYLTKMCNKERLIELMRDFVLFDGGIKKLPRAHQYFGVKAAQGHVAQGRGGIIWHTQGAGKSILMVLLARWILQTRPDARVVIVTDRAELDGQIEGVFHDAGEAIHRTNSGRDLMLKLAQPTPRLLCSLVHKFGVREKENFDAFIAELESQPSNAVGEIFVFVDECHRTQSGRLNRTMKAMLPGAIFIGFTGTPLLKKDKKTTLEVFDGGYIHTYKFGEAVEDNVVLDLIYEARDVDQWLSSTDKVDAWFAAKTRGLNNWQQDELKKKWGTMQAVLSSRSRMDRIVGDIVFDFSTKPRLSNSRGNAILVAASIHDAVRYYSLFQKTEFKDKCAIVTSYNPLSKDVTKEDTGANTESDKQFIYNTYTDLLKDVQVSANKTKTEVYEEESKRLFVKEPARMKLLIVVDKLLTGFDAPPCTYLYIDKSMQDHALFQAICRTNRLDGDDKDFGYVVDYKDLFTKVENAIAVYTSELDNSTAQECAIYVQDRLEMGRQRLEEAFERLHFLCEGVLPPRKDLDYIHFFCGNTEIATDLADREHFRVELYRGVATLVRAFANISDELDRAGYSATQADKIKRDVEEYVRLRETIRKASGETLDLKAYEADMRHLLDTYIQANEPRKISPFDDLSLIDLIVKTGIGEAIAQRLGNLGSSRDAIAETIENNVRSKIIKDSLTDPEFYNKMSALLDEIIADRKAKAIEYEEYLKRIAEVAKRLSSGRDDDTPEELHTPGLRALYNSLGRNMDLALLIDQRIKADRPDAWRGEDSKEKVIKRVLNSVLNNKEEVERIFLIIVANREY